MSKYSDIMKTANDKDKDNITVDKSLLWLLLENGPETFLRMIYLLIK
jgi:hypothetical protein